MWNLKKKDANELIYKGEQAHRLREQTCGYQEGRVDWARIDCASWIDLYKLLYLK